MKRDLEKHLKALGVFLHKDEKNEQDWTVSFKYLQG